MRLTPDPDVLGALLRKPAPKPKPKQLTARERAAANAVRVLQMVADHGHLRCCELEACWPDARYGRQMAQRTVRALVKVGQLKARTNALGRSYVLTRAGAAALEVRGIPARHGLDLASVCGPTLTHHAICSRWCLAKRTEGFQTFTEYALVNGYAPVSAGQLVARYRKLCDAVLIKGDRLYLCEVESAPKGIEKLMRIAALAEQVGRKVHPDLPFVLAGVYVVFNAEQNHGARIARAARLRWQDIGPTDRARLAGHITLARVRLGLPLVWQGCAEQKLVLTSI